MIQTGWAQLTHVVLIEAAAQFPDLDQWKIDKPAQFHRKKPLVVHVHPPKLAQTSSKTIP